VCLLEVFSELARIVYFDPDILPSGEYFSSLDASFSALPRPLARVVDPLLPPQRRG